MFLVTVIDTSLQVNAKNHSSSNIIILFSKWVKMYVCIFVCSENDILHRRANLPMLILVIYW